MYHGTSDETWYAMLYSALWCYMIYTVVPYIALLVKRHDRCHIVNHSPLVET